MTLSKLIRVGISPRILRKLVSVLKNIPDLVILKWWSNLP